MAISAATTDPSRVGGNQESAHEILAGLDVKAMRTTKDEDSYKHLENRDFEALEMYVMNLLMGIE